MKNAAGYLWKRKAKKEALKSVLFWETHPSTSTINYIAKPVVINY